MSKRRAIRRKVGAAPGHPPARIVHVAVPRVSEEDQLYALPWTPLRYSHSVNRLGIDVRIFGNCRYTVGVMEHRSAIEPSAPPIIHLSIHDHLRTTRHDWREFQRIKEELVGKEREAIEFYPPDKYLVDGANEYHLWVLPEGTSLIEAGFGFRARLVEENPQRHAGCEKSRQRPFPPDWTPVELQERAKGEE